MTSRLITIILTGILLVSVGFFVRYIDLSPNKSQTASVVPIQTIQKEEEKITSLYFVGDIMLDRGVRRSVEKNFAGSFDALFTNASSLKDADILFGNLEGPVSDRGRNVGSKYSFRFQPHTLEALKNAGFDIVSVANNHMGDWTVAAFTDTFTHLSNYGILHTGGGINKKETIKPTIVEKNGIKFGFLGFTDVGPEWLLATETEAGILSAKDPEFESIISQAKGSVDVLVVSIHWGDEYSPHNKRQEFLAHTAIDNGATLVIGHHPHVSQDTEFYKDGFIAYSLGNFIFDQYFSPETMQGSVAHITFTGKKLTEVKMGTSYLNRQFQIDRIVFE